MTGFPGRLKQLRISNNLIAKQIAEMLGVTYRQHQRYETGETDPPTSKTFVLANYFNVSLDYLVGRSDNPTRL